MLDSPDARGQLHHPAGNEIEQRNDIDEVAFIEGLTMHALQQGIGDQSVAVAAGFIADLVGSAAHKDVGTGAVLEQFHGADLVRREIAALAQLEHLRVEGAGRAGVQDDDLFQRLNLQAPVLQLLAADGGLVQHVRIVGGQFGAARRCGQEVILVGDPEARYTVAGEVDYQDVLGLCFADDGLEGFAELVLGGKHSAGAAAGGQQMKLNLLRREKAVAGESQSLGHTLGILRRVIQMQRGDAVLRDAGDDGEEAGWFGRRRGSGCPDDVDTTAGDQMVLIVNEDFDVIVAIGGANGAGEIDGELRRGSIWIDARAARIGGKLLTVDPDYDPSDAATSIGEVQIEMGAAWSQMRDVQGGEEFDGLDGGDVGQFLAFENASEQVGSVETILQLPELDDLGAGDPMQADGPVRVGRVVARSEERRVGKE